eukprot:CAMPEP_0115020564 /NCGR_PEP_ID=MMETSP0216-20121206/30251_1 /TAXON_ID=223996 /ORGANISM="Protocruzia adherens, Strain Boccale" /LENGTH=180 /DNA_ID=CAMNT_0002392523 /DNA_START=107 /DNA_END=649 /DNA_ORIENTATION=-
MGKKSNRHRPRNFVNFESAMRDQAAKEGVSIWEMKEVDQPSDEEGHEEGSQGSGSDSEEEEYKNDSRSKGVQGIIEVENVNHKPLKNTDGVPMTRRVREALEAEEARLKQLELEKLGLTEEAKANRARLEEVKRQRELAAQEKEEERLKQEALRKEKEEKMEEIRQKALAKNNKKGRKKR